MILLYHLVFPDSTPKDAWNAGLVLRLSAFKRQLTSLKKCYEILSLEDYMAAFLEEERGVKGKAAVTFDDGYRAVFDLVSPFLEDEQIPATFFATTSHLEDCELLWFVYINALCSEKCYDHIEIDDQRFSLTKRKTSIAAWEWLIASARESQEPIEFSRTLAQKYPLPDHVIAKYKGLTAEQIAEIGKKDLFDLGSHTHQHFYLDQIPQSVQRKEMLTNKHILEERSGQVVKYFAYTGGIYTAETIKAVKRAGFEAAFAITPRHLGRERKFEVPRVDIYSPSLFKFKAKIFGLHNYLRNLMHRGK